MNETINPYAVPRSVLAAAPDAIPFAGEITADDLPALLPPNFLRMLLLVLGALLILPFVVLPIALVALKGEPVDGLGGIVMFVLILIAAAGSAVWPSRRQGRADRLLAENPQFVGPIRGALSSLGYEREDPQKLTSIPWSEIRRVHVGKAGIRLDLQGEVETFVVIPAHCFSGYDALQMRTAIAGLRTVKLGEAERASMFPVRWQSVPENAIRFDGTVLNTTPSGGEGLWRQYGWISPNLIYSVVGGKEFYDSWQVVEGVSSDVESLTIIWRDQSQLRIPRQNLVDPAEWESLLHVVASGKAHRMSAFPD